MKLAVIGAKECGEKNNPKAIANAVPSQAITATVHYWEDLVFDISSHASSVNSEINKADLVVAVNWYKNGASAIYRDVALSLGLLLQHQHISMWNSEMVMQRSTTKLSCMQQLALEGIAVPHTLFSLDGQKLYISALEKLSFPMIVKAASASRGRDNHLVKDKDELQRLLTVGNSNRYLVQEFVPNQHDLRIICFGGKPALVLKRQRQQATTHLNNASQGGLTEWVPKEILPTKFLTNCQKICTLMGREMAGIDVIADPHAPGDYLCLEVNAVPQLTSGTDVAKKLAAFAESIKAVR